MTTHFLSKLDILGMQRVEKLREISRREDAILDDNVADRDDASHHVYQEGRIHDHPIYRLAFVPLEHLNAACLMQKASRCFHSLWAKYTLLKQIY